MDQTMYIYLVLLLLVVYSTQDTASMSAEEKNDLREQVLSMFHHGYRSYMDYAYPADELMPLSCKGRYRGVEKSRGDVDDILGNYSLTLIDTLDTLVILGELDEFENAVRLVINGVDFDTDIVVSVFEANIRVLGGLLGGHVMARYLKTRRKGMEWYRDELLDKARDIGNRLLPAFNTSTGMPYPRVNLRYGVKHVMSRTGSEKDTCTACAGTMVLEFSALSRLSGDPIYEEKAHKAMNYLWQSRHRSTDLVGTVINIHNGDWVRRDSGVGAGIDSYYEYLLKAYILLGDETYLDRFNKHYAAIRKYVIQGPLLLDVHMHKPLTNSRNFMDALLAFWPGLQVLIGDMKPAIETHEMLYQVMQRHNFLPEAFTTDFRVHWAHHPLRPEFLESTYFLYKATGDPHYLEVGKEVLNNLNAHARVKCGYAAIRDVTTGTHEDQMDSYVLAETFKYLYLLFSEPGDLVLDIEQFVFTTEAHLLPLSLSTHNSSQNGTRMPEIDPLFDIEEREFERTCPNTNHLYDGDYVKTFRDPLKNLVDNSCPVSHSRCRLPSQAPPIHKQYQATVCPSDRRPRLHAADFMAGNKAQMDELRRMGITVLTMKDGRVQLLHTAADAQSQEAAEDGMSFMQEMIELSKNQQAQGNEAQHEPCVVQFMEPPYLGSVVLNAGPAQFGHDLKKQGQVRGELVVAEPFTACRSLDNQGDHDVYGKIVLMERGECMFIDKARQIQGAGAIGGIVIDSHDGTSSDTQPLFAMSGDGKDDIHIPMVFVFHAEGQRLLQAVKDHSQQIVFLSSAARKPEDIMSELLSIPEQKAYIEERSSGVHETSDPDRVVLRGTATKSESVNLDGMQVNIRSRSTTGTMSPPSAEDLQVRGPTSDTAASEDTDTQNLEALVSNFVSELTQHTNFQSLRQTKSYLGAIKQMMAAISKGNYQLMDSNSLSYLEDLTKKLRPKVKDPSLTSSVEISDPDGGDSGVGESGVPGVRDSVVPGVGDEVVAPDLSTYSESLVQELNDEVDNVIIQELQRVVEEAAGLLPRGRAESRDGLGSGSEWSASDDTDCGSSGGSVRPYATAEELAGHAVEPVETDNQQSECVPSTRNPPSTTGGPTTVGTASTTQTHKDLGPDVDPNTSAEVPDSPSSSSQNVDNSQTTEASRSQRSSNEKSSSGERTQNGNIDEIKDEL